MISRLYPWSPRHSYTKITVTNLRIGTDTSYLKKTTKRSWSDGGLVCICWTHDCIVKLNCPIFGQLRLLVYASQFIDILRSTFPLGLPEVPPLVFWTCLGLRISPWMVSTSFWLMLPTRNCNSISWNTSSRGSDETMKRRGYTGMSWNITTTRMCWN